MKKIIGLITASALVLALLAGCTGSSKEASKSGDAKMSGAISVISREEGSGTRGAFTELMGVIDDKKNDVTTDSAEITNSTSVMLTTVAGNKQAIGYVSLGSLSKDVKSVTVDGVEATVDNIKSGEYKVSRPFNLIYDEDKLSDLASDFVSFILSKDGQAIVNKEGYISLDATESYTASKKSGSLSLAGSTSVSPLMEVIADAYKKLNPDVKIDIQQSGSSAGITSAIEGACDIGMSSRNLEDEEAEQIDSKQMALDGIAVIVNNDNSVKGLTSDQIKNIFLGDTTSWDEVA